MCENIYIKLEINGVRSRVMCECVIILLDFVKLCFGPVKTIFNKSRPFCQFNSIYQSY